MIDYNPDTRIFHLDAKDASYVMQLNGGCLCHLYWGKHAEKGAFDGKAECVNLTSFIAAGKSEALRPEFPCAGRDDCRSAALELITADGYRIFDPVYKTHRIFAGKCGLKGLPSSYAENDAEAQTLEVDLYDESLKVTVTLSYTAFENYPAIARSVRISNAAAPVRIERIMSAVVDMDNRGMDIILNSGCWADERHLYRQPITVGDLSIGSRSGISGHAFNPFLVLCDGKTTETAGDSYGFALVYSGNFKMGAETNYGASGAPRVYAGINPDCFSWKLDTGEEFTAPELLLVYSQEGIGGMSREFHGLIGKRLCRGRWRDALRPTVLNSWEAISFDMDERTVLNLGYAAADAGIETLVIDDGWFGNRRDDTSSLGDWQLNSERFPNGLSHIADELKKRDVKLGIWMEPEMVSHESRLYKAHPEWCLGIPGRKNTLMRSQLVLDLCREDVRDFIVKSVSDILSCADIAYLKWDMNRALSEAGSAVLPADRQGEVVHRYYLGLYEVLERVTQAFPDVLFESCASGGGRFDCGMLYYMPQTWTSDNLDAVDRLKIQYATSMVYPMTAISAHVSGATEWHGHRTLPLEMRVRVSETPVFGFEYNIAKADDGEKRQIRGYVSEYKRLRELITYGDYYRYVNPFESNDSAWGFIAKDKSEAFIVYAAYRGKDGGYTPVSESKPVGFIPFGLAADKVYINEYDGMKTDGAGLTVNGLVFDEYSDGAVKAWHFISI